MFEKELSKVETHLKKDLNLSKAETRPKENDNSSKVGIHLKDDVKSNKAQKGPKDNIRFHKRNGAAYQVPNNWEELYEKDEAFKAEFPPYDFANKQHKYDKKYSSKSKGELVNKKVTNVISDAKIDSGTKAPDYYTSLKREVKTDLKFAHKFGYKYTKKRNSRWNKKHLEEIERDKREVESWFESGIVYKAEAPKQTRRDPESSGIDPDAYVEMPKSKTPTLGDYFPVIPVRLAEDSSPTIECQESSQLSENSSHESEEVPIDTSEPELIFGTRQACFEKKCKAYYDDLSKAYPGWRENSENELTSEEFTSDTLTKMVKYIIDHILNPNEKVNRRKEIPLCLHGFDYHVQHLFDLVITESELMMEIVPREHLYNFSEMIRTLITLTDELYSIQHSREFYRCQRNSCQWRHIQIIDENPIEIREINPFAKPIYDLTSFESRLQQISNPNYGLTVLLKDSYDPKTTRLYAEYLLSQEHKVALEAYENHKSKGFIDQLEKFTKSIFATITTMKEFMKIHELGSVVVSLSNCLVNLRGHAWVIGRLETDKKISKPQSYNHSFRFQNENENNRTTNLDSGLKLRKDESISKELTLGNYVPTILIKKIENHNFDIFEPRESEQLSDTSLIEKKEINVSVSCSDSNFENKLACFKSRCKDYHKTNNTTYPGCCGDFDSESTTSDFSCCDYEESEVVLDKTTQQKIAKLADFIISDKNNVGNHEKKENEGENTPLCEHGFNHHVNNFSDAIYFEVDHMLEIVPRERLYDLAEAIRGLIRLTENLRSCNNDRKFPDCSIENCLWTTPPKKDNTEEKRPFIAYEPVTDSISFEVRVQQVNDPRYGLRSLFKDSYNPAELGKFNEHILGFKYLKTLKSMEDHKSKDFAGYLEHFTCLIFREIRTMEEVMKTQGMFLEVELLKQGLFEFHEKTWPMSRIEAYEKCSKLQCCGPFFRSRKTKDQDKYQEFGSDLSVYRPVDDQQLSARALSRRIETLNVKHTESKSVPESYCPNLTVECASPNWQYQARKNFVEMQDLDSAKREEKDEKSFMTLNKVSASENVDEVETTSF